jgi:LCP family protein required for cell wall assembly
VALTPAVRRTFLARFLVASLAALVVMVTSIVYLNVRVGQTLDDTPKVPDLVFPEGPAQGGNYLIIGSDTRAFVENDTQEEAFGSAETEGGQRSDTMMVLHVDPDTKTSLAVSFPRDLLVEIPGQGQVQINSVFNDGPQAVIDMMKNTFDVDINHYVEVNFEAFIGVVDAVGSIDVYFPYPARDQWSGLTIPYAGCQPLDGNTALAYVRSRHLQFEKNGSWNDASPRADIDRITRQQDFIRKLASKASAEAGQNPLDAIKIAEAIVPKLKIDDQLSKQDILRLVKTFRNVDPEQPGALEMVTLPWDASTSQPGRLVPKEPDADLVLQRLRVFGDATQPKVVPVNPGDVIVQVLNGTTEDGEAGRSLARLQERGFAPAAPGDAAPAPVTLVRYAPGQIAKAELVARYLGGVGRLIEDATLADVDVTVVIGDDWRGVHGKDKVAKSAPTTSSTTAKAAKDATPTGEPAC